MKDDARASDEKINSDIEFVIRYHMTYDKFQTDIHYLQQFSIVSSMKITDVVRSAWNSSVLNFSFRPEGVERG